MAPINASNVNTALLDLVAQHQHYLVGAEEAVVAKMLGPFQKALADVEKKLVRLTPKQTASWTGQRLVRAQNELSNLVEAAALAAAGRLGPELEKVFKSENIINTAILQHVLPEPLSTNVVFERIPVEVIQELIQRPLGGERLDGRLKTMVAGAGEDVRQALVMGVMLGEGAQALAYRIREFVGGRTMYNATRIARTEVHRVATAAQRATYDRNQDVIAGIEFLSTLDDRTCPACALNDGHAWYYKGEPNISGAPEIPVHPMCFVDGQVRVRVPGGTKAIKDIAVGDLVLTHEGRFRPVTELVRQSKWQGKVVKIKTAMRMQKASATGTITVTEGHPILVKRGEGYAWVPAEDIVVGDKLLTPASTCECCGEPVPETTKHCSNVCRSRATATRQWTDPAHRATVAKKNRAAMKRQYASGERDVKQTTAAAHEATRAIYARGEGALQRPEVHTKANQTNARRHGCSGLERLLDWAFKKVGVEGYQQSYQIKREGRGYFYADFAFPSENLVVEADGVAWHSSPEARERDTKRDTELKALGWDTFRLSEKTIREAPLGAATKVADLLRNHRGEIEFCEVEVSETSAWTLKKARTTFNFSVAEDESYVANGLVAHNCRCVFVPVTKSWEELGFTKADLEGYPGLADLDGALASSPTYGEWFARQAEDAQKAILGLSRFKDYVDGKLKFPTMRDALPKVIKPIPPEKLADRMGLEPGNVTPPAVNVPVEKRVFTTTEVQKEIDRILHEVGGLTKKEIEEWREKVRTGKEVARDIFSTIPREKRHAAQLATAEAMSKLVAEAQQLLPGGRLTPEQVRDALNLHFPVNAPKALNPLDRAFAAKAKEGAWTAKLIKERLTAAFDYLSLRASDNGLEFLARMFRSTGGEVFTTLRMASLPQTKKMTWPSHVRAFCDAKITSAIDSLSRLFAGVNGKAFQDVFPTKLYEEAKKLMKPSTIWSPEGLASALYRAFEKVRTSNVVLSLVHVLEAGQNVSNRAVDSRGVMTFPKDRAYSPQGYQKLLSVFLHEHGHALENLVPTIREAAHAFYDRRTAGERPAQMAGFAAHEVAREDRFLSAYTGKDYIQHDGKRYATEVTSMGLGYLPSFTEESIAYLRYQREEGLLWTNSETAEGVAWAAYDPDHAAFILNVLSGNPRG